MSTPPNPFGNAKDTKLGPSVPELVYMVSPELAANTETPKK